MYMSSRSARRSAWPSTMLATSRSVTLSSNSSTEASPSAVQLFCSDSGTVSISLTSYGTSKYLAYTWPRFSYIVRPSGPLAWRTSDCGGNLDRRKTHLSLVIAAAPGAPGQSRRRQLVHGPQPQSRVFFSVLPQTWQPHGGLAPCAPLPAPLPLPLPPLPLSAPLPPLLPLPPLPPPLPVTAPRKSSALASGTTRLAISPFTLRSRTAILRMKSSHFGIKSVPSRLPCISRVSRLSSSSRTNGSLMDGGSSLSIAASIA